MDKKHIAYKITLSGVLIAIAVILGTFSVPVFGGRMSPIIPVPIISPTNANSSFLNLLGTGSFLAFPGSMIGGLAGFRLGERIGSRATLVGGCVLIIIGTKILLEHTGWL